MSAGGAEPARLRQSPHSPSWGGGGCCTSPTRSDRLLPSGRCLTRGISASRLHWCRRLGPSALWPLCRESGEDMGWGRLSPKRGSFCPPGGHITVEQAALLASVPPSSISHHHVKGLQSGWAPRMLWGHELTGRIRRQACAALPPQPPWAVAQEGPSRLSRAQPE